MQKDKSLDDLTELLRKTVLEAEEMVDFAKSSGYEGEYLSRDLLHTLKIADELLKTLDQEKALTETIEPPRYGRWIPASTKPGVHAGMKCSECKARISYSEHFNGQHLYCHKCGAKMTKNEDLVNTFRTYAGVPGYEVSEDDDE
jgi:hypothetical protein